jgi:hypothetical protein
MKKIAFVPKRRPSSDEDEEVEEEEEEEGKKISAGAGKGNTFSTPKPSKYSKPRFHEILSAAGLSRKTTPLRRIGAISTNDCLANSRRNSGESSPPLSFDFIMCCV